MYVACEFVPLDVNIVNHKIYFACKFSKVFTKTLFLKVLIKND